MAHSVEMPELGESVTEGTVTQWLKKVGDTVEVDEPLLEVSTDKVDTEIPSPVAGVLLKIIADEDDTVDVGAVIAEIGDEGEESEGSGDSASSDEASADEPAEDEDATDDTSDDQEESAPAPASSGGGAGTDVTMPELGESVTEGTITQWLKKVGDEVEVDEPLLEVSTDKVDTEVPSPVAGTLLEILAEEDDTIDVGGVIARVGDGSAAEEAPAKEEKEPAPEKKEEPAKAEEPKEEPKADPQPEKESPKQEASSASDAGEPSDGNLPYVTPLVRKLAEKHGVDLSTVEGTGVGGRIRKQDVIAAAEGGTAKESAPAPAKGVDPEKASLRGTTQKVNRIRAITAKTTLESLHGAAQLTQVHEVDMTHIAELRKASKAAFQDKHGQNLTFLPFFAKAIVEALVAHPNVNASYNADTQEMTYHGQVNLGIAVDTKDGLLSPVIHDAQDMSLPELAAAIADIADRARNKKLKPNDVSGGTFTITNIGSEGALTDTPILVPPQAAMIGTGAIRKRPVVITEDGSDSIAIRSMVYLPMTYDHQIVDGADAGRFLTTIKDRLENSDFTSDLEI
ncbi:2-oxoglutarate dehydrogenase, E2 component, dihydrolipoamide succinyltransferase [Corynebacterium sp. CNJ-954]|uniref:2-oxoglutarate dehydrogenase, E2 component, dihydrolipoamide succinyltransferase n=1 Tax=Corynebacterium sp. CNJ-954 TaxID=1904962 RepID=UPI000962A7ED|nr:2-oxoglutarate dehydrogenase, E2 component, dihydrolipoamide succinyltransferase [Corynebacterium sp. CNJ-954]OLT51479.1 2-oxoglutarate dehydrogenase, E2 component, dihydrolipoamide succinyltransferase [Corynebacterium sp. CNJ-954]